jgi:hypothetical protein
MAFFRSGRTMLDRIIAGRMDLVFDRTVDSLVRQIW